MRSVYFVKKVGIYTISPNADVREILTFAEIFKRRALEYFVSKIQSRWFSGSSQHPPTDTWLSFDQLCGLLE